MKNPRKVVFNLPILTLLIVSLIGCQEKKENKVASSKTSPKNVEVIAKESDSTRFDTADYDRRMLALHSADTSGRWNFKTPYPLPGAILPYKRVVAFYGNLFSKRMGILGELPKKPMLAKLMEEKASWEAADPSMPVIPALHYIAITAQGKPGKYSMYRQRMPFKQIDTIVSWARSVNGIVFLDVQVGHSTVKDEVSTLVEYLKLPDVHLGLDPEFSMKFGHAPGRKIGTMSAADINDAVDILAKIVRENNLPPKILVVHRFTKGMVTDYKNIKPCPEVQIVMHMDGFGDKPLKRSTYQMAIYREPVQFTGFKLFYKNDNKGSNVMYTPDEVLRFAPKPVYIQYQ